MMKKKKKFLIFFKQKQTYENKNVFNVNKLTYDLIC